MNPGRSGIFRRYSALLGALCVAPVVVLGLLTAGLGGRWLQAAARERRMELAARLARDVEARVGDTAESVLLALAAVSAGPESPQGRQAVSRLSTARPEILELCWLDRQGRELAASRRDAALAVDLPPDWGPDVRKLLSSRRRLFYRTGLRNAPSYAVYGLVDARTAMRLVVSLEALAPLIGGQKLGETGFAVLVDGGGRLLLAPPGRLSEAQTADFPRWPVAAAASQAAAPGAAEFEDPDGLGRLAAWAPVPSLGGAAVLLQSRGEAYGLAGDLRGLVLLVSILAAALSLAGAVALVLRLTRPILALTAAAETVSEGNFLGRVEVETGDELQDLAETFNRMTAELRSYSVLHVDRLVAEQRKTEAILFSITDGIIMTDNEGKIQLANRRALEMLGLNPLLSIEGRTIAETVPDPRLREALIEAVALPKPESYTDVNLSTDKARRFLRVSALPVISPRRGAPIGIVAAVRDVTLLRELELMKDEFLQYMTHDLRNPVSSVIGFVEILRKGTVGELNPEQHNVTMSIKRASIRLMGMIDNILDIAKMEAGRISLQLQNVSIAAIAQRSISILESLAFLKSLRLELSAPQESLIAADADLMERIFVNLIGNAIKYTPEGGRITVSITEQAKDLRVVVEDTGEGIPHEYLDRVFGKFEQVGGQRRGGTGLGLTIVKFFVEAHLGRVWAESEPGRGSRFCFTIPKGLTMDQEGRVIARPSGRVV